MTEYNPVFEFRAEDGGEEFGDIPSWYTPNFYENIDAALKEDDRLLLSTGDEPRSVLHDKITFEKNVKSDATAEIERAIKADAVYQAFVQQSSLDSTLDTLSLRSATPKKVEDESRESATAREFSDSFRAEYDVNARLDAKNKSGVHHLSAASNVEIGEGTVAVSAWIARAQARSTQSRKNATDIFMDPVVAHFEEDLSLPESLGGQSAARYFFAKHVLKYFRDLNNQYASAFTRGNSKVILQRNRVILSDKANKLYALVYVHHNIVYRDEEGGSASVEIHLHARPFATWNGSSLKSAKAIGSTNLYDLDQQPVSVVAPGALYAVLTELKNAPEGNALVKNPDFNTVLVNVYRGKKGEVDQITDAINAEPREWKDISDPVDLVEVVDYPGAPAIVMIRPRKSVIMGHLSGAVLFVRPNPYSTLSFAKWLEVREYGDQTWLPNVAMKLDGVALQYANNRVFAPVFSSSVQIITHDVRQLVPGAVDALLSTVGSEKTKNMSFQSHFSKDRKTLQFRVIGRAMDREGRDYEKVVSEIGFREKEHLDVDVGDFLKSRCEKAPAGRYAFESYRVATNIPWFFHALQVEGKDDLPKLTTALTRVVTNFILDENIDRIRGSWHNGDSSVLIALGDLSLLGPSVVVNLSGTVPVDTIDTEKIGEGIVKSLQTPPASSLLDIRSSLTSARKSALVSSGAGAKSRVLSDLLDQVSLAINSRVTPPLSTQEQATSARPAQEPEGTTPTRPPMEPFNLSMDIPDWGELSNDDKRELRDRMNRFVQENKEERDEVLSRLIDISEQMHKNEVERREVAEARAKRAEAERKKKELEDQQAAEETRRREEAALEVERRTAMNVLRDQLEKLMNTNEGKLFSEDEWKQLESQFTHFYLYFGDTDKAEKESEKYFLEQARPKRHALRGQQAAAAAEADRAAREAADKRTREALEKERERLEKDELDRQRRQRQQEEDQRRRDEDEEQRRKRERDELERREKEAREKEERDRRRAEQRLAEAARLKKAMEEEEARKAQEVEKERQAAAEHEQRAKDLQRELVAARARVENATTAEEKEAASAEVTAIVADIDDHKKKGTAANAAAEKDQLVVADLRQQLVEVEGEIAEENRILLPGPPEPLVVPHVPVTIKLPESFDHLGVVYEADLEPSLKAFFATEPLDASEMINKRTPVNLGYRSRLDFGLRKSPMTVDLKVMIGGLKAILLKTPLMYPTSFDANFDYAYGLTYQSARKALLGLGTSTPVSPPGTAWIIPKMGQVRAWGRNDKNRDNAWGVDYVLENTDGVTRYADAKKLVGFMMHVKPVPNDLWNVFLLDLIITMKAP